MEQPKIYLETTIFSFFHETRNYGEYPKYTEQVHEIFKRIKAGAYIPFTSSFTLREIAMDPDRKKQERMTALVPEYRIMVLDESEEANWLAEQYVKEGAISPNYVTDALHIAAAVVNGLDFIVSLNFTHIVRTWTIELVRRVNKRDGYLGIGIYKPSEVLEL